MFAERLREVTAGRRPKGCTQREIEALDKSCNYTLPDDYKKFMAIAGKGLDGFLVGSDFTFSRLEGAREAADELLLQAGLPPLPDNAFVFLMHQGYQFFFFLHGAVYYYAEGNKSVQRKYASFRDFFEDIGVGDMSKG